MSKYSPSTDRPAKAVSRWLVIFFRSIISLSLIGGAIGLFLALGTSKPPQPKSDDRLSIPIVETTTVSFHDHGIQFEVDGVVVPLREINIAAEVQGRVKFKAENCRTQVV